MHGVPCRNYTYNEYIIHTNPMDNKTEDESR